MSRTRRLRRCVARSRHRTWPAMSRTRRLRQCVARSRHRTWPAMSRTRRLRRCVARSRHRTWQAMSLQQRQLRNSHNYYSQSRVVISALPQYVETSMRDTEPSASNVEISISGIGRWTVDDEVSIGGIELSASDVEVSMPSIGGPTKNGGAFPSEGNAPPSGAKGPGWGVKVWARGCLCAGKKARACLC